MYDIICLFNVFKTGMEVLRSKFFCFTGVFVVSRIGIKYVGVLVRMGVGQGCLTICEQTVSAFIKDIWFESMSPKVSIPGAWLICQKKEMPLLLNVVL